MLAFARGGNYQPRLLDLNDSVQQALQLQLSAIPDNLVVEQQLASELWPVSADVSQIVQVIGNLLTNAAEAGHGRGRIRVRTATQVIDELRPVKNVGDLEPGRYVSLVVEDTGDGMSTEVLARVFEPFFTTKFQGRGMGMAAVYGIVQNHGGDISIESEAGQGTVVTVHFPAVEHES
jgi:signal transduction histidine kinase